MVEEFVMGKGGMQDLLRGTTDEEMPQKAGQHGDRKKWDVYAADLQNMELIAGITAVSDWAQHHSTAFHHFALAPCPYYGWPCDFKAHAMAVQACAIGVCH